MNNPLNLIPKRLRIGGVEYKVRNVERCDGNILGECCYAGGYINIADVFGKGIKQSDSSKLNTFFQEIIHLILDHMNEDDLNNEKFVSCFAGFLTDAMTSAEY